jgi:hypothetical protein
MTTAQADLFDVPYVRKSRTSRKAAESMKERAPYQKHSETSRKAAERIAPAVTALRRKVLDYIKSMGHAGATDNEGIADTGIGGSTYRPRRGELERAGLVVDSGGTRKSPGSRTPSAVWVAKEFA